MKRYTQINDEELMFLFQKGDYDAYNEIVDRYKNKLITHIFFYLKDREASEDVVQDALVRLYLNKDKYNGSAKLSTWVYTIAINLAKTALIKRGKVNKVSITAKDDDNSDFEIKDESMIADKELYRKELNEKIFSSIDKLDEKLKEVVLLRDINELSYEEIADILEIPIGTVKSRLNRARFFLKDAIYDYIKN